MERAGFYHYCIMDNILAPVSLAPVYSGNFQSHFQRLFTVGPGIKYLRGVSIVTYRNTLLTSHHSSKGYRDVALDLPQCALQKKTCGK